MADGTGVAVCQCNERGWRRATAPTKPNPAISIAHRLYRDVDRVGNSPPIAQETHWGAFVTQGLLLVDDHPLFRSGFAALAAVAWPDRPLLTAPDGEVALVMAAGRRDIAAAIIDIQLPGRDGFDTAIAMASIVPAVPRILISGREDAAAGLRARGCGASALIAKSSPAATIVAVIETVLAGGDGFASGAAPAAMPQLSPRQIEVLCLLSAGQSNQQMCAALGIAERTVRAHLTEIFDALGVNSRVQAILQAQRLGLIG